MDLVAALEADRSWRLAVWALRGGYVALIVVVIGLIALSAGSTPWVLAIGVVLWLVCALTSAAGFLHARSHLAPQRPGFLAMRKNLLSATIRRRPTT